jgi:hypothetical protein
MKCKNQQILGPTDLKNAQTVLNQLHSLKVHYNHLKPENQLLQ